MSVNEITCVHELFAKYNAILRFAQVSHRPPLDKETEDAINAIKPVFVAYRGAIKKFEASIDLAVDQLKWRIDWDAFQAICDKYEKMPECDVVQKIIETVCPNGGGGDGK
jgi:hypothetical protein